VANSKQRAPSLLDREHGCSRRKKNARNKITKGSVNFFFSGAARLLPIIISVWTVLSSTTEATEGKPKPPISKRMKAACGTLDAGRTA